MTIPRDDPAEIAEVLIRDNGVEMAIEAAHDGTTKAQRDGDNYALSVWREVKTILRNSQADAKASKN